MFELWLNVIFNEWVIIVIECVICLYEFVVVVVVWVVLLKYCVDCLFCFGNEYLVMMEVCWIGCCVF